MSRRPTRRSFRPRRAQLRRGVGALVGLLLLGHAAVAAMTIEVRDGLVSATIEEASVEDVVRALGDAVGAEVVVRGEPGPAARQRFSDLPFEAALKRLVGGNSYLVRYRPAPGDHATPWPSEIRIYARGGGSAGAAGERPARLMPRTPEAMAVLVGELLEGDGEALGDELDRLYADARDIAVRRSLVATLSRRRAPAAANVLERALDDRDADIRTLAARGLWASRGVDSEPVLEAALEREPDPAVRQTLRQMLRLARRQSAN